MATFPKHSFITVEEYFQLEQNSNDTRHEYIDGYVTMLAGGTLDHSIISTNISSILHRLLHGSVCRVYSSDARVRLSEARYVYPDVTVSCHEQDKGRIDTIRYPRLVVEVLSPGTANYDRGRKFSYYRECATLQEYILVNTDYPTVEVYRRERQGMWLFYAYDLHDDVELTNLKIRFPVSDVYENVSFPDDGNQPA